MTLPRSGRRSATGFRLPTGGLCAATAVSLGLHALLAGLAWHGLLFPTLDRPARQVYTVEIVALAAPKAVGKPVAAIPAPPTSPAMVVPKKSQSPAVPEKPPRNAGRVAPTATGAGKSVAEPGGDSDDLRQTLARLQEKRAVDQAIAQLKQRQAQQSSAAAEKAANEKAEQLATLHAWYQRNGRTQWRLLAFDSSSSDIEHLEVRALVRFDRGGRLTGYDLVKRSGDKRFDESVRRTIERLAQIPSTLNEPLQLEVLFNLKDFLNE